MKENIFKRAINYIKEWIPLRDRIILCFLVIILILVLIVVYKSILLSSIVGKAHKYEQEENAYQQITNDVTDSIKSYQIYKKGDKVKTITITRKNTKVVQYSTTSVVKTYVDSGKNKTVSTNNNESETITNITVNYIGTTSVWEIINQAIVSSISSEKVDGISCYVITGTEDKQLLEDQGIKSVKLYVEKDSGLPMKKVYDMESGEQKVTSYEYEFGIVTDKDMKEPGITQYRAAN